MSKKNMIEELLEKCGHNIVLGDFTDSLHSTEGWRWGARKLYSDIPQQDGKTPLEALEKLYERIKETEKD